jgi:hypothetical protein
MPVKIIYKNRRSDMDRRKSFSTYNGPERRSGIDRRKLEEKLKHLIESNVKDQNKEKQKLIQPSSGNVILRRKGEKDKPPPV